MGMALRSWWQKIKQHWVAIVVGAIVLVGVIVLIVVGYRVGWTGFTGKTLWEWLQLLIIPLVLAVGALLFNLATTRAEQRIALEKQREDLLQTYLDRMSELLLKEGLRSSEDDAEVRNVARVRTITVLFQLDARRIGYVFAFLREAGLMSNQSSSNIVSLDDADLSRANLSETNLSGAYLWSANLSFSDLSKADLSDADLHDANLKDATGITIEDLEKQARSLEGAIMPDGSKRPSRAPS